MSVSLISSPQGLYPGVASVPVPCGTCRLCCRKALIIPSLEAGDDPSSYRLEEVNGVMALAHKENGDCIYLNEKTGCTIHGRAPAMCRVYDCRKQHAMYSKEQRAELMRRGILDQRILRRGAALIHWEKKHGVAKTTE